MATESNSLDGNEYECPTCGKTGFASEWRVEQHHRSVHDESLDLHRDVVQCDWCGEELDRRKSDINDRNFCDRQCKGKHMEDTDSMKGENHPRYNRIEKECEYCGSAFSPQAYRSDTARFCSNECYGNWRSGRVEGEDHPCWDRIELECTYCGNVINRRPSSISGKENLFCDTDCMYEWQSENIRGEAHHNYNSITLNCDWCGESFNRPVHAVNDGVNFCTRGCADEWRSQHQLGENNPNYRGGVVDRRGFTDKLKAAIRKRDNFECCGCGMGQDSHVDEIGKRLHVHHIIPIYQFDDSTDAHTKDNLVTLCYKCHNEWEKMAGLKPQVVG